jgi:hypothetical protein
MKPEAPRGDWQSTQTETDVLKRFHAETAVEPGALLPTNLLRAAHEEKRQIV